MVDPSLVAATIALGNPGGGALPIPHGANAVAPARVFVTVHGDSADAIEARTAQVLAPSLATAVDVPRRQVEVRIPNAIFDPSGQRNVRIAVAAGLWDPATAAYVPQNGAAFFNAAFRGKEPPSPWRTTLQAEALRGGDLTPFAATVDFVKLAAGASDESDVPSRGFMDRILVSAREDRQGRGDPVSRRPGCESPCALQYSGRLQPYAIYVPPGPVPDGGWGLTLDLHGCGQTYNIGFGTKRQRQLGGAGAGSVVLTPEARGDCYWYFGQAAADVFEAWADVARQLPLDSTRTAITGISMGGYGAYKLAAAYPDLFGRVGVVAACPGAGITYAAPRLVPGGRSRRLMPVVPSLAGVPVMSWQTTDDVACGYRGQRALVDRMVALGFRYSSLTFTGVDHKTLATVALGASEPIADFLGAARVDRDPLRVSYVYNPAMHEPQYGLGADHAYWVSRITPQSPDETARIDITSYGFGRRDPGAPAARQWPGNLHGLPYVADVHLGGEVEPAPAQRRLRISATGVYSLAIDAKRARVGCSPAISVVTPQPIDVRLDGCGVTYRFRRVCRKHKRPDTHRRCVLRQVRRR
jgi:pimeloyl-ACP methyl ester carboxylesterase